MNLKNMENMNLSKEYKNNINGALIKIASIKFEKKTKLELSWPSNTWKVKEKVHS